jgi:hypothetical protein
LFRKNALRTPLHVSRLVASHRCARRVCVIQFCDIHPVRGDPRPQRSSLLCLVLGLIFPSFPFLAHLVVHAFFSPPTRKLHPPFTSFLAASSCESSSLPDLT